MTDQPPEDVERESPSSIAVTQGIRVSVWSQFLRDGTSRATRQFKFSYTVLIENEGPSTAQLVSRHWIITRGDGSVEEVKGPGVIGQQPVLAPGRRFEYTSGAVLPTPHGTMHGTYHFVREDGDEFDAEIAPFLLREPGTLN